MTDIRFVTDHKIGNAVSDLEIEVIDEPGSGGANHRYEITGFDTTNNPSSANRHGYRASYSREIIIFQNGPINEVGVNGVTHEALLAVVADRLRSFQKGPFSCKANACALTHIEEALHWLQQRTIERMRRGVEGTHQV